MPAHSFFNPVLISGLLAMLLAQLIKLPMEYIKNDHWDFRVMTNAGGMPSSHSSLVTATTLAIGLFEGFNTSLFALALAISMIVIYDAAGVRRQAGIHAEKINLILEELFSGQPISQKQLKEVLGHTPLEVAAGTLLGLLVATGVWLVLK
jgi:acid phosphatase family membrane protein YuiD